MIRLIVLALCLNSFVSVAQERSAAKRKTVTYTINDLIGTWILKKYADKHLHYQNKVIKPETVIFTKDSVFVIQKAKKYKGTWKFNAGQPIISIKGTKKFDYNWLARGNDHIFFTRKGLGYYKYFERNNIP